LRIWDLYQTYVKMKTINKLLIGGGIVLSSLLPLKKAQAQNTIKKFASEATYAKNNNILKFRPFDYTLPSKTQRVDFLLGKRFGDLSLYGYYMFDNKDRSWIGARLDYGKKALDGKLRANLQLRYLHGLNEKTKNKIYFIPMVNYNMGSFNGGIMGYGVKSKGEKTLFFIGPSLSAKLTKNISTIIAGAKSPLDKSNLLYWKTNFNFGKN